jgi:hypothetical protein
MKTIISWCLVLNYLSWYLFFKLGISSPPNPDTYFDAIQRVVGGFTKWNRYIRVRGGEHCPPNHPVIYCGNHILFGDPFYVFRGVYLSTKGKVRLHAMSRNDFFEGTLLKTRFFDADEFIVTVGVHGISRDAVTLAQMKVFMNLLMEGESFTMFQGRTRSRSGLLMEYRDNFVAPGSISLFLNTVQRRKPDMVFSAVPVSRNYNPARDHTCMVYGPEQFLPDNASRDEQRAYDYKMVELIGNQVEVCVPQVVSVMLYTACLHHLWETESVVRLTSWVRAVREESDHPYWDGEDDADLGVAVDLTLKYLAKCKILSRTGDEFTINTEKILSVPDLEAKYYNANPVKYMTNQLLHLGDLIESIQVQILKDS